MAMLRNKNITFSLILMCLIVVSPIANAQLGGLDVIFPNIAINIQGRVMCSTNGSGSTNNPFANAGVTIQCAGQNVSATTTGVNGAFVIPITRAVSQVLSALLAMDCNMLIATPLATCNNTLPNNGSLRSNLSLAGVSNAGGLSSFNFFPTLFTFVP